MIKSRIFLFLLLSFIGGILVRSFFEIDIVYIFFLIIFSIISFIILYKNKLATLVVFILFFFVLGFWKVEKRIQLALNSEFDGKNIQEDVVVIKKTYSSFGQNLIIKFSNPETSVLLRVPAYPEYHYGDMLRTSCILKSIENKNTDFDYRMYMAKDAIFYFCEDKKYEKISQKGGNFFMRNIMNLKSNFEKNLNQWIPSPEGILAAGILFGGSDGLSEEIKNDFSRTGMTHIVAVSGYNVTIIAEYLILLGIFIGLWRRQAIWFALGGVFIFVVMIGLPSSAVRAGVMSGILLWAIKNGRLANSENAIIFAAAIMLYINPMLLRWDTGFQLSFLATLGIVSISPFLEKSFMKKYDAFGILEIIVLSIGAQIFVLPIIAYSFKSASLVSLLANVLILPIVPISMLLAFLVSLSGFIFTTLTMTLAWISYVPLHYELLVIHILSKFSFASLQVNDFNAWWILVYYSILFIIITFLRKKMLCQKEE